MRNCEYSNGMALDPVVNAVRKAIDSHPTGFPVKDWTTLKEFGYALQSLINSPEKPCRQTPIAFQRIKKQQPHGYERVPLA